MDSGAVNTFWKESLKGVVKRLNPYESIDELLKIRYNGVTEYKPIIEYLLQHHPRVKYGIEDKAEYDSYFAPLPKTTNSGEITQQNTEQFWNNHM